ncbi:MAG: hypothetical protein CVU35_06625 [Betaproteobacteria bacterium HGW-Betaproteobacteria-8]|nr:MAG: hypothetical protein CVU35_06625 [Betaproteobacteria bacterium HGW-Betaproteobacteria-8]
MYVRPFNQLAVGLCFCSLLVISPLAGSVELEHQDALETNPALSLKEVLNQTFSRNPQQYQLQARDRDVLARRSRSDTFLPKPPALLLTHQNDALGSGRGEREWQADMEIPLWRLGQRAARTAVAENARTDLEASKERLLLEAAGQLREAVWEVKMVESQLALAKLRYGTAEALQHDVERRHQAGELAKTDLMLAQQETLQARTEVIRADAELNHARHRYMVLTGLKQMPGQLEETQSSLETYSDEHALWREAEARVALTEQERNLSTVESKDNLQLVVNTRSQRGPFDNAYNDSVGLSLRIPLNTESHMAPQLAAADMHVAQAVADRERLRFQLETAMHEAEHNLEVTRAELEVANQNHAIAKENLRLSDKAFQLGEIDLVSLMRTRAQAYEAERALRVRQIQLTWDIARYNQAVGVLP